MSPTKLYKKPPYEAMLNFKSRKHISAVVISNKMGVAISNFFIFSQIVHH